MSIGYSKIYLVELILIQSLWWVVFNMWPKQIFLQCMQRCISSRSISFLAELKMAGVRGAWRATAHTLSVAAPLHQENTQGILCHQSKKRWNWLIGKNFALIVWKQLTEPPFWWVSYKRPTLVRWWRKPWTILSSMPELAFFWLACPCYLLVWKRQSNELCLQSRKTLTNMHYCLFWPAALNHAAGYHCNNG